MPIYEYKCDKGHVFEVMQRMTDDPVGSCQTCDAPVQRVFHPVAVHFKGKGFYNTDYGTKKRAREAKDSGGDSAGATGDSKPSTEKKSETKSSDSSSSTTKSD